jgi:hypothetical protein
VALPALNGSMVGSRLEEKNQGKMSSAFCGKGFFVFLFENKADMDLIFRSDPYFMGIEECT